MFIEKQTTFETKYEQPLPNMLIIMNRLNQTNELLAYRSNDFSLQKNRLSVIAILGIANREPGDLLPTFSQSRYLHRMKEAE